MFNQRGAPTIIINPAAPNLSHLGQLQSFTIDRPLNAHTGQQAQAHLQPEARRHKARFARRCQRWKQSACSSTLVTEVLAATESAFSPACVQTNGGSARASSASFSAKLSGSRGPTAALDGRGTKMLLSDSCSPARSVEQPKPKPGATYDIGHLHVCAPIQQQPHRRLVAVEDSQHDRRRAVLRSHHPANDHAHPRQSQSRPPHHRMPSTHTPPRATP